MYWYWLCNIKGIGQKKTRDLLDYFGEPEAIWHSKEKDLMNISSLNAIDIKNIIDSRDRTKIEYGNGKLLERGIRFISIKDKEYPDQLRNIYDPPYGIYVKGALPESQPTIAIIGARKCSSYGKEMALYFGRELAKMGIQIVSGLARGIDTAAHQGAIEANGKTFSVLGNGPNICYPKENIHIMMEIEKTGGIISEYNLDVQPCPGHFPMRNRIISGLSHGILVVEAAKKSGSLITAEMGLEQGKDIYALPGRVSDKLSEGTNELIKLGAKMVTNLQDILEEYNIPIITANKKIEENNEKIIKLLDKNEKMVYACLSLEPKYIEDIASSLKSMRIQEVLHILFMLEVKGAIKQLPNQHFIINV